MTSPYLTVKEAAEIARCGHITVRRAIKSGALLAFRPGGNRLVIRQADVHAWIESRPTTMQEPETARRRAAARPSASGAQPGSVADLREIERKVAAG